MNVDFPGENIVPERLSHNMETERNTVNIIRVFIDTTDQERKEGRGKHNKAPSRQPQQSVVRGA